MSTKSKNPRSLKKWVKWTIAAISAAVVGTGVALYWPNISKSTGNADLVGGIDNFLGWAPGIAMN